MRWLGTSDLTAALSVAAALACGGAVAAQGLKPASFDQSVIAELPISGAPAIGLMSDPGPAATFRQIFVRIPANSSGELCVWITSVNGRYRAVGSYRIPRAAEGRKEILELPATKHAEAGITRPIELAILAHFSSGCGGDTPGQAVVAGWNDNHGARVGFMINAGSAVQAFRAGTPCEQMERLTALSISAYNFVCWMSAAETGKTLIVKRISGGSMSQPISLAVLPDASADSTR